MVLGGTKWVDVLSWWLVLIEGWQWVQGECRVEAGGS